MGVLKSHLDRRHVFSGVEAADRDELLRQLVHLVADAGGFGKDDATTVLRAALKRERMGTTGIGRGVAIPHCKTDVVAQPLVAFARSAVPIEYGATDGAPVRSVFLVISRPEIDADAHVAILRTISKAVRDDYTSRILANTSNEDLLFDLFCEWDAA